LKPFDGDLDDYRDWLFTTKLGKRTDTAAAPAPVARKEQQRHSAAARQHLSEQRKPIEARIRRLETQIQRHTARAAELQTLLSDPALYTDDQKDTLKARLFEQATQVKELKQLEAEWLEQQTELESLGG
jgi:ATP-binding cassette subfamily F protein 3